MPEEMERTWNFSTFSTAVYPAFGIKLPMRIDFSDRENKRSSTQLWTPTTMDVHPSYEVGSIKHDVYELYIYMYVVIKCYEYIYMQIYKGDVAYEAHFITDYWNAAPFQRMDICFASSMGHPLRMMIVPGVLWNILENHQ